MVFSLYADRTPSMILWTVTATGLVSSRVVGDDEASLSNPLWVKGYQAVTNRVFVDPAEPGFLQVRFSGEGGVAHFGLMQGGSDDQKVSFATGELTAHLTLADAEGDEIVFSTLASTAQQPDGHVTFLESRITAIARGQPVA